MTRIIDIAGSRLSRRGFLAAGLAIGGAPLLASQASAVVGGLKVSKDCVHYKEVASDEHRCGACRLFRGPDACLNVAGTISQTCGCRIWLPKTA